MKKKKKKKKTDPSTFANAAPNTLFTWESSATMHRLSASPSGERAIENNGAGSNGWDWWIAEGTEAEPEEARRWPLSLAFIGSEGIYVSVRRKEPLRTATSAIVRAIAWLLG